MQSARPAKPVKRKMRTADDAALRQGSNVWEGKVVCEGVAESLGMTYVPVEKVL